MKKNSVLTKILCVFKPKKIPCDIVTEAENIINSYISSDDYSCIKPRSRRLSFFINIALICFLAAVGYIALKILI